MPAPRPCSPAGMPIGPMGPVPIPIGMIGPAAANPNPGMVPRGCPGNVRTGIDKSRRSGCDNIARRTTTRRRGRTSNGTGAGTDRAAYKSAPPGIVADRRANSGTENAADHRAGGRVVGLVDAVLRGPARICVGVSFILLLVLILVGRTLLRSRRW